jgi:hypothetical protein
MAIPESLRIAKLCGSANPLAGIRIFVAAKTEPSMSRQRLDEIWNPFGEQVDGLSPTERYDMERAQAWSWYLNGGGGDPSWFDRASYMRSIERGERER